MPEAVQPVRARVKGNRNLCHGLDFLLQRIFSHVCPQLRPHLFRGLMRIVGPAITDTHGHGKTVPDQNRPFCRTHPVTPVLLRLCHHRILPFRKILINRIIKKEFSPLQQHHGSCTDSHLCRGILPVYTVRGNWLPTFQILYSMILLKKNFTVSCHRAAAACRPLLQDLLQQPAQFFKIRHNTPPVKFLLQALFYHRNPGKCM